MSQEAWLVCDATAILGAGDSLEFLSKPLPKTPFDTGDHHRALMAGVLQWERPSAHSP